MYQKLDSTGINIRCVLLEAWGPVLYFQLTSPMQGFDYQKWTESSNLGNYYKFLIMIDICIFLFEEPFIVWDWIKYFTKCKHCFSFETLK